MGTLVIYLALLVLIQSLFGWAVGRYAESKDMRFRTWFWAGLIFWPGAVFIPLFTGNAVARAGRAEEFANRPPPTPRGKQCPGCAETIQYVARVCKHCGYRFEAAPKVTVEQPT